MRFGARCIRPHAGQRARPTLLLSLPAFLEVSRSQPVSIFFRNVCCFGGIRCGAFFYILMTKIYVGGLPYQTDDNQLQQIFSSYGEIASAKVITDRDTGRSKGFGFVEMNDDAAAQKAIAELHEAELGGRTITVNIARPMERSGGGGGGHRGGGGGRGGFGGGRGDYGGGGGRSGGGDRGGKRW